MRAILVTEYGPPEVLRPADVPDPRPGPGEVLVDVAAAGVNFIDVYQRSGAYPVPLPYVAGVEAAGTVTAVGPGVSGDEPGTGDRVGGNELRADDRGGGNELRVDDRGGGAGFRVGDRVGWVNLPGAYAERAVVPADRLVPIPDGLDLTAAASVLLQGMTAHYLTHDTHRVRPGDTVLVHAAAGGMGLMLTRLVKLLGGHVIGTVSTAAKQRLAEEAGADHVIRYRDADVAARVRELTAGRGVAAVYDGVGGPTFEASLASLRPRGVLALYGQAGGPVPPVDPQRLNAAGSVFLTRPNLSHHIADPAELRARSGDLFRWLAGGKLEVCVRRDLPLTDAHVAHQMLETGSSAGKLVLVL
ncbi:quinone oxidoreductase family protein [Actinomadura hibisca]|uniref:quinone oxidoreductase family protein n=1 Tax=Actinomadura hibisca TaxID=68565 RepID=UPI000830B937|nr:quinone oxidoreductase [Actinomadura hibisca]